MSPPAFPANASAGHAVTRLPGYATSLLNRASDRYWERRLGIRTTGGGSPMADGECRPYGYLAYHTYFSIFRALTLQPADVVADLGCGKGRVVCIAAQHAIQEVIGVDIDPQRCAEAEQNAARLRTRRAPIRILCQSATALDFDAVTVIVMFHPFGAETMRMVMTRLHESIRRRPRPLRIAYANPLFSSVLAAEPWLELAEVWHPHAWSRLKFPVHFYRTPDGPKPATIRAQTAVHPDSLPAMIPAAALMPV